LETIEKMKWPTIDEITFLLSGKQRNVNCSGAHWHPNSVY